MISDYQKKELFYAPVYNYGFYRERYNDLVNVFGDNRQKYLQHFLKHGMQERRMASPRFNVEVYRSSNPDLSTVYADNWKEYYFHYLFYGLSEGRRSF